MRRWTLIRDTSMAMAAKMQQAGTTLVLMPVQLVSIFERRNAQECGNRGSRESEGSTNRRQRRNILTYFTEANGWGSFNVLQCALGTWCCREASDRTNCCSNSSMLISGTQTSYLGRFLNTTSSSTTDANGTTVVTNVTTTEISTITATASSSSSSSTTVVGAAVGAVLGVAFIAALSGLLWAMNKIKNMKKEMEAIRRDSCANTSALMAKQEPYYMPQQTNGPEIHAYEADNHQRHEIDGIAK